MYGLDMAHGGSTIAVCAAATGSLMGVVGGVVAVNPPDPATGTAGLYVGIGGILMGAATLIGVLGDKLGPHAVAIVKIMAENKEENRKNREARHRLANELQAARCEMEALKLDAAEARRKANESENLAIEATTRLAMVERKTDAVAAKADAVAEVASVNSARLDTVEARSGDDIPATSAVPPAAPPSPGGAAS